MSTSQNSRKLKLIDLTISRVYYGVKGKYSRKIKWNDLMLKDRIKNIRISLGMDQETFGMQFSPSVSGSAVSRWEKGNTKPNKQRLKKIAELGHTNVNYLLYGYDFNPHELINYVFDNYLFYYYFSMENVKWGDEEYSLHDSVEQYFKLKKIELPESKFYDEEADNIVDEDTAGVKEYMMNNLTPLTSTKYIDRITSGGGFTIAASNNGTIEGFNADTGKIIGTACNLLLDEIIKVENLRSPLRQEFSKMAESFTFRIETALQNNEFEKAHKLISSFIKELNKFNEKNN